jgi:hypothetical protein
MSFLLRSAIEVKTVRAMKSRSILENHSSTWLSQKELGWRDVQVDLRMRREKVFDQCALVRREVVCDDADFFATRLVGDDVS